MKALRRQDGVLDFMAPRIEKGIYDEDFEKYAVYYEDDIVAYYVLDMGYELIDFDESLIPEDYVSGKYFYIDGEFVPNPDWQEPPLPTEEQVKVNTENIEIVAESADESEAAICDLDEYYNEKIEELEARIAALEGRA